VAWQNGYKVLTPSHNQTNIQTVNDIILLHPAKQWNTNLIDQIFIPSESYIIKQTPLIMEHVEDELMWPHTIDGTYSVKTGYNLLKHWLDSESPSSANSQNKHWKKLWALNTIPRHKALLWRIIQNSIPVKTALSKRGITCNPLCPRCLQKEETIEHAFMHCERATRIWFGSNLNLKFDNSHNSFADWIIYIINSLRDEEIRYIAAITYGIWFARNQHAFNQHDIEDMEVITKANTSIHDFILATNSNYQQQNNNRTRSTNNHQQPRATNRNTKWRKPEAGVIKINSDANLTRSGTWGIGVICRDNEGNLVAAATWVMPGPDDATLAEAFAIYNAIHFARDCCFLNVRFESDNACIIRSINNGDSNPRNYAGNVIRGIHCNRNGFRECSFHHINREANQAAHKLASLAHEEPNRVWIEEYPTQLAPILVKDLLY
jgi:hypothetical protein